MWNFCFFRTTSEILVGQQNIYKTPIGYQSGLEGHPSLFFCLSFRQTINPLFPHI